MTERRFDGRAVVDVHLMMGAFYVVRPAFPIMARAGYGRVVLTGSIGGIYGTHNVANYGVAKAGTIGLNNLQDRQWFLPPEPMGYFEHMEKSFEMARKGIR